MLGVSRSSRVVTLVRTFSVNNWLCHHHSHCLAYHHNPEWNSETDELHKSDSEVCTDKTLLTEALPQKSQKEIDSFTEVWDGKLHHSIIFHLCKNAKDLFEAKNVYNIACRKGLEYDPYVSGLLVEMFLKVEAYDEAHILFSSLHVRSVFSWNLMIRAFANQGQDSDALQCLLRIHGEASIPDKYTFGSVISSCINLTDIRETVRIHSRIIASSHDSGLVIGNALINAYSKCGSIIEAQKVFDKMMEHDSVSWDTLIIAHVQHKLYNKAIFLFYQQQHEGVLPTRITYVAILDACVDITHEVLRTLARIFDSELQNNVVLGTAIVNMFSKLKCFESCWQMFHTLSDRNLYTWNSILTACCQLCETKGALELYSRMLGEAVLPNEVTIVRMLSLCTNTKLIVVGKQMHASAMYCNLQSDAVVGNSLINMYSKCGKLDIAQKVFDCLHDKTLVSWTSIISACVEHGKSMRAIANFDQMLVEGLLTDKIMSITVLDACVKSRSITRLRYMHVRILNLGLDSDPEVSSSLGIMYGKCGSSRDAWRMFDKISEPTIVLWTAMISAHAQDADKATQIFDEMKQRSVLPNDVTFFTLLDVCAKNNGLLEGKKLHLCLLSLGYEANKSIKTALVDMYGKCGSLEESEKIYDETFNQDIILITAMMASYAQNGKVKQALNLFDKAQRKGIRPDEVTFINILSMCNHAGLLNEGRQYFSSMLEDHNISPSIHHYNCMIDMLGRAGCLHEAEDMIIKMPYSSTTLQWMSLLSACKRHHDVERGEQVAQRIFKLDPDNPQLYVELSNIYATVSRDIDVKETLSKT